MKQLRTPLQDEIRKVQLQIANTISDINFLLKNYDEQLVKEYVLFLAEEWGKYNDRLEELSNRLAKQFGDFEYVNPKYKDSFNPERY